eukprot:COSAG04_NODE_2077_length_4851_cov_6.312921_4_plen_165_part_00
MLCGYATRGSFLPPFAGSGSGSGASAEGTGAEEAEDKEEEEEQEQEEEEDQEQDQDQEEEEEKGCGPALVLDVCCGTGTIGLALARHTGCRRVLGVENCAPAVDDARINASLNDLDGVASFSCGAAEAKIGEMLSGLPAEAVEVRRFGLKMRRIVTNCRDSGHF